MTDSLFRDGDSLKIVITLDAYLCTETDGLRADQIESIVMSDECYGLKSIIAGRADPDCKEEDDTQIVWDSMTVEVIAEGSGETAIGEAGTIPCPLVGTR